MNQFWNVLVTLPARLVEPDIDEFERVFSELLDCAAVSFYRQGTGEWIIEALFNHQPDMCPVNALLAPFFEKQRIVPAPLTANALPDLDWLAQNRASFPPRRVGRFWVYGSHIKKLPPVGSLPLLVDASLAFGSGTHPTTEGCLRALQMIPATSISSVLDMGCGSGILSIAAHRIWRKSAILAADNDRIAIGISAINRKLNNIAPSTMRLLLLNGFGNRFLSQSAPYDIIFANILARPLIRMAPDLCRHLARRGWFILSGILNEQAVLLRNAYQAQKILCWHQIRIGGWTTLLMRPASCGSAPYLWRGQCPSS